MKVVSNPTSDNSFHHEIPLMTSWIVLAPVPLYLYKPFLKKLAKCLYWFRWHRVAFLRLKDTAQNRHFCQVVSPKQTHERPRIATSVCWLHCCFYCFDLLFWFHWQFLTRRSLWFPLWLLSVGGLGEKCKPSDIKNSITSELKLLKKIAEMSNGYAIYWCIASILKRKRV